MNYWIRAYNNQRFRVADFIHDNGFIDWGMRNRFEKGDIVFLYATAPESRITFMMEVTSVALTCEEIVNDESYYISQQYFENWLRHKADHLYVRYSFLKEFHTSELSLAKLRENGMQGTPRSPRKLWSETVDYIMGKLND